jgi:ABC-type amino acid transport substrate-binding protein
MKAWLCGALLTLCLGGARADWAGPEQVVRFAPEQQYGPFVFEDTQGRLRGLSVELLASLQVRSGLRVQNLPARPLHRQLQALREGQADLISSLRPTPQRGEFLLFTRPYVRVPALLVVAATLQQPPGNLDDLAGRQVAVGSGYAVEAVVRARHPRVAWQPVADDAVALAGVSNGRYAAAVVDRASLTHLQRGARFGVLRVIGPVGFEYELSFAVRRDWPALRDALDRALAAYPRSELEALSERWMQPDPDALTPSLRRAAWVSGTALLALGLALLVLTARRPRGGRS